MYILGIFKDILLRADTLKDQDRRAVLDQPRAEGLHLLGIKLSGQNTLLVLIPDALGASGGNSIQNGGGNCKLDVFDSEVILLSTHNLLRRVLDP